MGLPAIGIMSASREAQIFLCATIVERSIPLSHFDSSQFD